MAKEMGKCFLYRYNLKVQKRGIKKNFTVSFKSVKLGTEYIFSNMAPWKPETGLIIFTS